MDEDQARIKRMEFLNDYCKDTQLRMRQLIDNEYKWFNLLIVLYPAVITGFATIVYFTFSKAYHIFIVCFFVIYFVSFLAILTHFVRKKIFKGHELYRTLGKISEDIWQYFKLYEEGAYLRDQEIITKGPQKYGTGKGWELTYRTVFWLSFVTITLLILIGGGSIIYRILCLSCNFFD